VSTIHDTRPYEPEVAVRPVAVDLYRDIHKGIRSLLFDLTADAGRLDPSDQVGRSVLSRRVHEMAAVLASHAEHEDTHVQPAMQRHLPDLAEQVAGDHVLLESRIEWLCGRAAVSVAGNGASARHQVDELYMELASFTSAYLAHQDMEERVIMPQLAGAIGTEATLGIHQAIVSSIPPDEMAASLAFMLPAMNIDDRTELLGGMQAGAPPEVFAGVWDLTGSVLSDSDHTALGARLGR
jgi:hypothetical protein